MKYTKLGKTGIDVSKITLGMMSFGDPQRVQWNLDIDEARPLIKKAIDLGINFFDTADVYSAGRSEEITGEVLKDYRDDIVIATKVFFNNNGYGEQQLNKQGLSRYYIRKAIDKSLKRLQMDHVDLYQIHRLDKSIPAEELMQNLNTVITEGKTLFIGASSMYAWQFAKLQYSAEKLGLEKFQTMQNHYSLAYREEEREMFPLCQDLGVATLPWSPLARGFLSGKYKRNEERTGKRADGDNAAKNRFTKPEDYDVVERVVETAQNKGVKPAQIALAWMFSKDYVTSPIIGATKNSHVEEAVEALNIQLAESEVKYLEEPYQPHQILGHS